MTNTFIQNKWIFEDPLRMLKRGKITRKGSHFFQRIIILVPIYRKMDFFVFSSTFKPFQFQWTPKYELLVVWRGDLQKNVKLLRIIFLTQRQQFPHLWIICWSHFPHFWPLSSAFGSFFWLNWSRGVGSRGSSSSLQSSCSHLSILTFPNGLPWMGTLKSHEWTPNAKYEPLVLWKGRPRVMTGQSIQKYWIFEGPLKGPWYWGGGIHKNRIMKIVSLIFCGQPFVHFLKPLLALHLVCTWKMEEVTQATYESRDEHWQVINNSYKLFSSTK